MAEDPNTFSMDDLISFDDAVMASPNISASTSSAPVDNHSIISSHEDSFTELVSMMQAKRVPSSSTRGPNLTEFTFETVPGPCQQIEPRPLAEPHPDTNSHVDTNSFSVPSFELPAMGGPGDPPSPPQTRPGSAMGRSLAEKEMVIKTQGLEIGCLKAKISDLVFEVDAKVKEAEGIADECDYVRSLLASEKKEDSCANTDKAALENKNWCSMIAMGAIKDQQLKSATTAVAAKVQELAAKVQELAAKEQELAAKEQELEETKETTRQLRAKIDELSQQVHEASSAQAKHDDHEDCARKQTDLLAQREKVITDLRLQLMETNLKLVDLEDENEVLKETASRINMIKMEDLRIKLLSKTSECNRLREQARIADGRCKQTQERMFQITNNGLSLQGAAHVVKPQATSKLPDTVNSCTECYANNAQCDNDTVCRRCNENNSNCLRWRCSLKHKLGQCPLSPCKLPHDVQGWLMLPKGRPEW